MLTHQTLQLATELEDRFSDFGPNVVWGIIPTCFNIRIPLPFLFPLFVSEVWMNDMLLAEQATPKLRRDVNVMNYMTKTTTINVNKVSLQIELEGATQ